MKRSRVLYQKILVSHQIVPYPQQQNQSQAIPRAIYQWWENFVAELTRPPEPKVRQKSNRRGEIWWEVYDPYTNLTARFASELEVRMWLDQRHYQSFH